jgi:hypothetical protein
MRFGFLCLVRLFSPFRFFFRIPYQSSWSLAIKVALAVVMCLCWGESVAQTDPNIENGLKPYWTYDGGNMDQVSLHNGGLTVRIPLFSYPQRGDIKTTVVLMLGSKGWHNWQSNCPVGAGYGDGICQGQWHTGPQTGIGASPLAFHMGMYLAIDDGMPIISTQPMALASGGRATGSPYTSPNEWRK